MKSGFHDNDPDNLTPPNADLIESSGQESVRNFQGPVEHVTDIHCSLMEIITQTELLTEQCPELERYSVNDDAHRKSALSLALHESVEEPPTLTPMIKGTPESVDHMPIRTPRFQRTTEASTLEKLMQARLRNWRFFNAKNKREFVRKHVLGIWKSLPMKPRELCRYSKILAKELENANLFESATDAVCFMSPIQQVLVLDILQDLPPPTLNTDKSKKTVDQQKLLNKKTKVSLKDRKKQAETIVPSSAIHSAASNVPPSTNESFYSQPEGLNIDEMLSFENLTKHAELAVLQSVPQIGTMPDTSIVCPFSTENNNGHQEDLSMTSLSLITEPRDVIALEIPAMTDTSNISQPSKKTLDNPQVLQNTASLTSLKTLEEQTKPTTPQHVTSPDTTTTNGRSSSPNRAPKNTRVRDNVKILPKPYSGFRALNKAAAKGLPKLKMPRFPPAPKSLTEQERMILQNLGMTDSLPPTQQLDHDVTMWRTAYGQHMSTYQGSMPNNNDHMFHPLAPASDWITTTNEYYHLKQPPKTMQKGGMRPHNQGMNQARSIHHEPMYYSQHHKDTYGGPMFPPQYTNNNCQKTNLSSQYQSQYPGNHYDNRQNQNGYDNSEYRNVVSQYPTQHQMNSNPGSSFPPNNNNDNQPK
uniref:HMG box domain-containing protein n=1 Tax=Panagrellus redivivus TaxID=6233 RepID=A0A7E4UN69_PANRE